MELAKMAGTVAKQLFSRKSVLSCRVLNLGQAHHSRCLSTSHTRQSESSSDSNSKGWLKNILSVRTLPASKESHSSLLSNKETVYEMQFHAVKPENMEEYLKQFESFQQLMHDKGTGAKLIGSFTVEIGDQDEAVHIWQYPGGYPVLNNATEIYRKDKDFIDYRLRRNKMLRSRKNQILLPFSFWPEPTARGGSNIYEMRSYTLKPGTMIEWGNNWARGIENRRSNNEAVAGLFTHLGTQYVVHHLWGMWSSSRQC